MEVKENEVVYYDEPSLASVWAIDYEPYRCNICGEFAGYRPNDTNFVGICSFKCARKYLELKREEAHNDKP